MDSDLDRPEMMPAALQAIDAALRAKRRGELVGPPRQHLPVGELGELVFTIGGLLGVEPVAGFRVYDTFSGSRQDQVVAVWSADVGRLKGLVVGERLGALRTGAIGGLAIRLMSRPDAARMAIIGTGGQARAQLEAAAHVRRLTHVRVHGRDAARRETFAREMSRSLGLAVEPADSVEAAVRDADIVVCATNSTQPVIKAAWLKPGTHVTTIGPKLAGRHEIDLDIAQAARWIATDSPEQMRSYRSPFFLEGTVAMARMQDLADLLEHPPARAPEDISLFCSTGLAGTEVVVASRALELVGESRKLAWSPAA
jgi:ornithine cyclodeaminase